MKKKTYSYDTKILKMFHPSMFIESSVVLMFCIAHYVLICSSAEVQQAFN